MPATTKTLKPVASVQDDSVAQMVQSDDWELNPVKACLIDNPDCEACQ